VPARLRVPVAVLVVAGVWAWLASALPLRGPGGPGPGFVPLLLAGVLAVLGVVLLLQAPHAGTGTEPRRGPGWRQAGVVVGLLALYVAALAHVGYVSATLPFLGLGVWLCGGRSPLLVVATAVGFTAVVWIVLGALFGVPLPRGPWG
jgi:hypothetical protein